MIRQYSDRELYDMYEESLDECLPVVTIGLLEYLPSVVLKAVDAIAYDMGFAEWLEGQLQSGNMFEHTDGNYYDDDEQ